MWENLEVKDDNLYKQFLKEDNTILLQLVAPQKIRETIFHQLHHNKIAGHFGKDRTLNAIRTRFYWPRITENIKLWCLECDLCARCKPGPGVGKSPLRQSKSSAPLERINVDIVGPLPITTNRNEYIIVLGDYYSNWKEAFPVPDHTAMTVADKIITEFICRFGCPLQLHTDQGKEFESHLFKTMCKKIGVQKTHSTPYRPQSSGLVERYNRSLKQMLSMFVNEHRNDWDEHIPYLMMAYRSTVHSTTKCTPNSLMLRREIRCPVDLMFGLPNTVNDFCRIEYVEWVKNTLTEAYKHVYDHSGQAAQRQKSYYDRGLKVRKLEPNCWVWRWYPPKRNQTLGLGWTGPYLVIEKITDVTYKIQKSEQTKSIMVHVDHLKPYLECLNQDVLVSQALTPVVYTPERQLTKTRIGRTVKPRDVYSPISDEIVQIRADKQELQQFHHLVIRPATPIFHPLGQYCPVSRCCTMYKYSTLRELHTHWQYLHQANREIFKCGKCRKMFGIKSRCFRQIFYRHHVSEVYVENYLKIIITPNIDYIETRGAMLPRLGTPEENAELIAEEKRVAQRKREEEARVSPVHFLTERLEAAEIMERDFF
ncbi:unnamed protein product [Mytilus coruscus]|uniref:Integrase catalytic domain-containing protein n=1 Tax=Mytilus coruscus TaxID=42192 RepID=A0A6J8F0D8_MYTCO|nr:unnamed protein product [Mytilus coruscus]